MNWQAAGTLVACWGRQRLTARVAIGAGVNELVVNHRPQ